MSSSQPYTSRRLVLVSLTAGLVLTALVPAASRAQGKSNIHRKDPEDARRLPGIEHLFRARSASQPPRIESDEPIKLGEVLVRFPLELTDAEVELVARSSGARDLTRLSPLGLFLLKGPPSRMATQQLINRLWYSGEVVRVQPNSLTGRLTFTPNDPHFGNQWHHEQASDVDLDSTAAWEITRGSSAVVVAATDSGIDVDHPEFAGRLFVNPGEIPGNGADDDGNGYDDDVHGWNPIGPPEPNGDVDDFNFGHGTWVAGVLLANSDNAFQVAGLDHFAKLLPIKMVTTDSEEEVEMAAMVAGLDYLVANPGFAQIVNMSVAHYDEPQPYAMLYDALSAAAESHILIGGSGNTGGFHACHGLPNEHPDVILVGGTTATDTRAFFSSFGPCVDFVAPADDIYTASFEDPNDPSASHLGLGTSFAVPVVSGIASLGLSIWPNMSPSDFYEALKDSAVDLGPAGKDNEFGWGRVNAYEALDRMQRIFESGFEAGDTSEWD